VRAKNLVTVAEQQVPGADLNIAVPTRASMIARCGCACREPRHRL